MIMTNHITILLMLNNGTCVERDEKKANYYCELAAILGVVQVRHILGSEDGRNVNNGRAISTL